MYSEFKGLKIGAKEGLKAKEVRDAARRDKLGLELSLDTDNQ